MLDLAEALQLTDTVRTRLLDDDVQTREVFADRLRKVLSDETTDVGIGMSIMDASFELMEHERVQRGRIAAEVARTVYMTAVGQDGNGVPPQGATVIAQQAFFNAWNADEISKD